MRNLDQVVTRGYLLYGLNRHFRAGGGYAWSTVYDPFAQENRLFQQADVIFHFKKLSVIAMSRLEQRMFEHLNEASVRFRERIRCTIPVRNNYYLIAAEDLYINLNDVKEGPAAGFDQNRISFGVGKSLNERLKLEVTYQNQYVNRTDVFDDRSGHTIVTNLYYDF